MQFYNLLNDVYALEADMVDGRFEIRLRPLGAMHLAFPAPPASHLHGPAHYETLPVSRGDHGVQDTLRAQLMAEMALLHDTSMSFIHKIERILKPRLESGDINIEDVAVQAGVSVRTLQTRLENSGLNFRSLLDRMRHAQALVYMGDPSLSLIDMAHMLGFATQSNFHHGFKRWTDTTPGQYRQQRVRAGAKSMQPSKP